MSNKNDLKGFISSFSTRDRTRFERFLALEYADSVFIDLFSLLSKSNQNLTNQAIFQHLYPSETYRDDRIRLLLSRAKKIILTYVQENSKSSTEKLEDGHLQLKKINQKNWTAQIEKQLSSELSSYGYYLKYEQASLNSEAIIEKGDRTVEPQLQEAHNRLDDYYFIEKLKLACNSQNYANMSGYKYHLLFLESVIDFLETYDMREKSLLYLYFHTYKMIREQNETFFHLIYDYLKDFEIPEHNDYREILLTLINFSIQRLNRGDMKQREYLFQIYQWQISSKNIYIHQKLPANTYKNIINLALHIKEYAWAFNFIESEKDKLLSVHPLEDYQLVMAKYYYETEDYEKCIQLITIARPLDVFDNLLLRVLQCKAYYELDEYEMIDNTIHNAKLYLLRHKSKAYQYLIFKNFFLILKKILQSSQTKRGTEKIKADISQIKQLAERAWLLRLIN